MTQLLNDYLNYKEHKDLIPIGSVWEERTSDEVIHRTILKVDNHLVVYNYKSPHYNNTQHFTLTGFINFLKKRNAIRIL